MPEHHKFEILGYALNWWVSAVVVPGFLGLRWLIVNRRTQGEVLVRNQAEAIRQLTEMNASLAAQLNEQRENLVRERAASQNLIDQLQTRLSDERRMNGRYENGRERISDR